jgi:hypothetical protein
VAQVKISQKRGQISAARDNKQSKLDKSFSSENPETIR